MIIGSILLTKASVANFFVKFVGHKALDVPIVAFKLSGDLERKKGFKYKCRSCKYTFTETSGTIFEKTRTPISKWICAIGLFKIGISANQLKDEI
jgi:hypothetical protein